MDESVNKPDQKPVVPEQNTQESQESSSTVSSRASRTAPYIDTRVSRRGEFAKRSKFLVVALALMASLATGFVGGWLGAAGREDSLAVSGTSASVQRQLAASESQLISSIASTVGPSVVSINVTSAGGEVTTDFFGFPTESAPKEAAGTGIIISSEGLIVTNRHVVPAETSRISVTLSDGTQLDNVKVVGRTTDNDSLDIAFLKIEDRKGKKLTPAAIGDSSKVRVGDQVVAIGNALGQFNNTVTSGIISGFGRSVQASSGGRAGGNVDTLTDLFQTDAAINQGNSGGPLVNADGQVIGINTAVAGNGQNIGFAIPINDVKGILKQVLATGSFERPYLGVRYVLLTPEIAKELEVSVNSGAYITPAEGGEQPSVLPGSPAEKAGLKSKDIITAVDGTKLDAGNSLTSLIGRYAVGEQVKLTIMRGGKSMNIDVTLAALPKN